MSLSVLRAAAAAASLAAAAPASATWSIILVDTRTGEVAAASATCLTGFDLRANTPVLIPGIGAATAQSAVDSSGQNRVFIRDRLALGVAPQNIVTQLATFDSGHQNRQYGIGDAFGRMATFTGSGAGQWAGGQTGTFASSGQVGTIAYAIQGNVLTGSPVVEQAVQAAITTPGDLPAKLMASMQAARLMGGDGRCSCAPNNPTGCGAPPPSFTKSAHIAYMLIARAGDTEGSNGIYRTIATPGSLAVADINGDQWPDLISGNLSPSVSFITNLSGSVAPPLGPIFSPTPTLFPVASGAESMILSDLNGDLILDLITLGNSTSSVSVFRGSAAGTFTPATSFTAGGSPKQIVAAPLDSFYGPDMAIANSTTNNISIRLDHGAGGFIAAPSPTVDAGPVGLVAANVVGSPAIDLIVACRTAGSITILRGNGNGTFTLDQSLPTSAGPTAVIATDLDGDTDPDIAVCCDAARTVQFVRNDGGGAFTPTTYALTFSPADLAAGDVNGDNKPDIIAAGGGSFATLFNQGAAGGFAIDRTYSVVPSVSSMGLADLDGDGDRDLAFAVGGVGGIVTVKNLGPGPKLGKFNDGFGCATGDYFMNFNIANQTVSDPDPVAQLQVRFDQWRAALVSRPDAVQSVVTIDPPYIPSVGPAATRTTTLTFNLRDWHGDTVTSAMTSIAITHAPGSPALAAIGAVQPQGGGVYRVTLTGGKSPGIDRLRITVDDGSRPVTLMPDPALSIFAGACYANCDASIGESLLTANDFSCFLERFVARDPYANCDSAPAFTASDFQCFINRFAAGCP